MSYFRKFFILTKTSGKGKKHKFLINFIVAIFCDRGFDYLESLRHRLRAQRVRPAVGQAGPAA